MDDDVKRARNQLVSAIADLVSGEIANSQRSLDDSWYGGDGNERRLGEALDDYVKACVAAQMEALTKKPARDRGDQ